MQEREKCCFLGQKMSKSMPNDFANRRKKKEASVGEKMVMSPAAHNILRHKVYANTICWETKTEL